MQSLLYKLIAGVVVVLALIGFVIYMKSATRGIHSTFVDDLKAANSKSGMPDLPDISKLRAAAQKDPNSAKAQATLAHALFRHAEYTEALPVFETAIRLNPTDAELLFERAKIRENTGHRAEALPDYEQTVMVDPKHIPAMLRAAELWRYERDPSRSIQWCRRVLELEPNNAAAHRHWALALEQQGESAQAISEFEAALRADPNNDTVFYEMGMTYKRMGDIRSAHDAFDRACKLNPRSRACTEAHYSNSNE